MKLFMIASTAIAAWTLARATDTPAQPAPPAAVPPEIAPHVPSDLRSYFVAFLLTPAEPRDMPFELFVGHQAHIRRQIEAGAYRLVVPFSDGGRIRGMVIVSAPSESAARALVEADPAVEAGVFAIELHPAVMPSLDSLRIEYPPRPVTGAR